MPADALSEMDYDHKWHCDDCKEVSRCQGTTQREFWKIWPWVSAWLFKDAPPPAPNHVSKRSAASAKEPDFISNGEWEIMVSDGRQQTNSIIWFYRRGLNTAKTRVYEPKIFQARLRTKGLYKNGANWKIRLLRFLNRFFFLKNI